MHVVLAFSIFQVEIINEYETKNVIIMHKISQNAQKINLSLIQNRLLWGKKKNLNTDFILLFQKKTERFF